MREKRVSLGISAGALSSRTGISTAFITMIERGGCDDISVGYALKLEQALGLPYGFFGENMPTEKCDIRPAPTECLTEAEKKKLRMPSARMMETALRADEMNLAARVDAMEKEMRDKRGAISRIKEVL